MVSGIAHSSRLTIRILIADDSLRFQNTRQNPPSVRISTIATENFSPVRHLWDFQLSDRVTLAATNDLSNM